jgi:hypothetical protein
LLGNLITQLAILMVTIMWLGGLVLGAWASCRCHYGGGVEGETP